MSSIKSKLPTKTDIKFLVSEDLRIEGQGKFSLLGVFAGERFAVGGDPPEGVNAAFVLPSLALLFLVSGGEGKFSGSVRIVAPDGKTVIGQAAPASVSIRADRPATIANISKPFIGPAFGEYTVELEIGSAKYKFPLVIDRAPRKKRGGRETS